MCYVKANFLKFAVRVLEAGNNVWDVEKKIHSGSTNIVLYGHNISGANPL